ncbi:hypothetical protein [Chitinophaga alhagiae]|uniref:hypothetical protein n=1 Tax=Chitinophaga alhagiae TaxID=2203219 RepID=UPI000E5A4EA7|nr:hypothetical protein [Chitinophaga alhagiae]
MPYPGLNSKRTIVHLICLREACVANSRDGGGLWDFAEVTLKDNPDDLGYYLKGFGQDIEGEVYLTVASVAGPSGTTGKVFKLVQERGHGHNGGGRDY